MDETLPEEEVRGYLPSISLFHISSPKLCGDDYLPLQRRVEDVWVQAMLSRGKLIGTYGKINIAYA